MSFIIASIFRNQFYKNDLIKFKIGEYFKIGILKKYFLEKQVDDEILFMNWQRIFSKWFKITIAPSENFQSKQGIIFYLNTSPTIQNFKKYIQINYISL